MTATVVGEDAAERPQNVNEREGEVVVVGDEIEICEEKRDSRQGPESQVKLKVREVALLVPTLALLLDSMKLWGIGCCRTVKRRWAGRRAGRQGEMSRNTELGEGEWEPDPRPRTTRYGDKDSNSNCFYLSFVSRAIGHQETNYQSIRQPSPRLLSLTPCSVHNPEEKNAVTPALHYIHS